MDLFVTFYTEQPMATADQSSWPDRTASLLGIKLKPGIVFSTVGTGTVPLTVEGTDPWTNLAWQNLSLASTEGNCLYTKVGNFRES